jgi:predicted RND superfamily exporter protein
VHVLLVQRSLFVRIIGVLSFLVQVGLSLVVMLADLFELVLELLQLGQFFCRQ